MALPVPDRANNAEFHDKGDVTGKAAAGAEARASSGHESSSSSSSSELEDAPVAMSSSTPEHAATPPPMQLMERQTSSSSSEGDDPGRIPAAVFERDDPSESNKDWSMMSTESVFGLQVAPSSDFTGFFLAHPELMDIATPPRSSTVTTPPRTSAVDAAADAIKSPISPPFDSIPELPETTMTGNYNYSFAFPNLIEDKRNISKKAQQEEQPLEAAAPTERAEAAPAQAQAETQAQRQASRKPEAAPVPEAGKGGGLFSCFPCC